MELFLNGLKESWTLIQSGDQEVLSVTWLTLKVCFTSILFSSLLGIPLGALLGLLRFRGRRLILAFVHIGMGLPPVVAGLWITMLLWRNGPLGNWELLYTNAAIVMAQILVSLPIVTGLTCSAFQKIDSLLLLQVKALGATKLQMFWILLKEMRIGILAAIIAGFGRVVAEVGAAMMVGGNIQGDTRILTTSIVMEVSKGNFELALSLSFILMALAFSVTLALTSLQQGKRGI